ncbi:uncharacterized protein PRD47_002962 [Ara ararauna]
MRPDGSVTPVLAWAPVSVKAPACSWAVARGQARPGSGCGLGRACLLQEGWGTAMAYPAPGLGAKPLTFLLPLAASGASLELAAPSTTSTAASRQSPGSQELESSRASTSTQAASGQTLGPEAQETSSPSSSGEMPSGPGQGSPVRDDSSRPSPPRPDRRRHQARASRQTQTPYTRPRGQRERSRRPATRAASNTRSQAVPRLSQCSPSRETCRRSTTRQQPSAASRGSAPLQRSRSNRPSGPMRVRDRARLQRQAQAPYVRPRRRSQDSRTPAARAGRSPRSQAAPRLSQCSPARASRSRSRSTARQRPSTSSRGSRARRRGSTSTSTGPVWVRDCSRLQRWAQTPNMQRKM